MRTIGNTPVDGEVRAVASGALANGDTVVVNADGTVSAVGGGSGTEGVGTPVVFETASVSYTSSTYDSNSDRTVVIFMNSGSKAAVGTIDPSDNSISFGTPVQAAELGAGQWNSITFDASTNKVAWVNNSYCGVGTVDPSDNSISFGTPIFRPFGFDVQWTSAVYDSNSNRVVFLARKELSPQEGWALVGTVSGTSLSFGSPVKFQSGTVTNIAATFDSNSNRVVIAFRHDSSSNYGKAIVGSVDPSDNSISFGTAVTFNSGNTYQMGCGFDSLNNKAVISYRNSAAGGNSYGTAIVGTVDPSDNSISYGTSVVFHSGSTGFGTSVVFDSAAGKIVIAYDDDTNVSGRVISGTVSGTSITFDTAVAFESGNTQYVFASYDSTSERVAIVYEDDANLDYGTSNVFSVGYTSTNLTAENFIGFADGAAADGTSAGVQTGCSINDAQSGLTAGQDYYVQLNGTLSETPADPSVLAGTAVSATKLIVKG